MCIVGLSWTFFTFGGGEIAGPNFMLVVVLEELRDPS